MKIEHIELIKGHSIIGIENGIEKNWILTDDVVCLLKATKNIPLDSFRQMCEIALKSFKFQENNMKVYFYIEIEDGLNVVKLKEKYSTYASADAIAKELTLETNILHCVTRKTI